MFSEMSEIDLWHQAPRQMERMSKQEFSRIRNLKNELTNARKKASNKTFYTQMMNYYFRLLNFFCIYKVSSYFFLLNTIQNNSLNISEEQKVLPGPSKKVSLFLLHVSLALSHVSLVFYIKNYHEIKISFLVLSSKFLSIKTQ